MKTKRELFERANNALRYPEDLSNHETNLKRWTKVDLLRNLIHEWYGTP